MRSQPSTLENSFKYQANQQRKNLKIVFMDLCTTIVLLSMYTLVHYNFNYPATRLQLFPLQNLTKLVILRAFYKAFSRINIHYAKHLGSFVIRVDIGHEHCFHKLNTRIFVRNTIYFLYSLTEVLN